ncbi:dedicator of cytokinesis protein 2-like [Corticium candelabrum]|uniref:dedicator of cytokinesis protein 2-like n=1 Tax=Corticium candelabrum TaxID=121492 RepID=UPI002E26FAD8|nr:dedicator of cytokinesis protein 2-like [Corticium candelabrum]
MAVWTPTTNAKYAVVVHDFTARNDYELTLPFGAEVHIQEECGGWYRGCLIRNKSVKGIFPSSYVHLKDCHVENDGACETVVSKEDPIVQEVSSVLREWGSIWKKRYCERRMDVFNRIRQVMLDLLKYRRQICSGTLPQDRLMELKQVITNKIDWGNWKLELDLVPRNSEGEVINPDTTSIHHLYNVHIKSQREVASAGHKSGTMIVRKRESHLNHLYIDFKCIVCHIGDEADLYFSVYDPAKQAFLSERYVIRIARQGLVVDPTMLHATNAVFEDLSQQDLSRDLYLVCHIIRVGRMQSEDRRGPNHYRRPYGVAVYPLKDVFQMPHNSTDMMDVSMPIITVGSSDGDFVKLHDYAISRTGRPSDKGLQVSLRTLRGDIEKLKRENPTLFGKTSSFCHRLGFSDAIMPGELRNDLYVTLLEGEFERGNKKSHKNIEVSFKVVSKSGQVISDCIYLGTGTKAVSEYRSLILRHNNHPVWNETVKVCLPFEMFHECHLRFCFRHCSTRTEGREDRQHFAFVRLQGADGTTLKDDKHELFVYKAQLKPDVPDVYMGLPCGPTEALFNMRPPTVAGVVRSERERCVISTLICSTKLTQNAALLSLLKWRGQEDRLKDILTTLFTVRGDEIVRFLQDTFDALFAILDYSTSYSQSVFDALAYILELLMDPRSKYQHFQSVLDAYIQSHFANTKSYERLLSCLSYYLENIANPSTEFRTKLSRAVSAIEHIFKFIIKSRSLYARVNRNRNFSYFRESMDRVFRGMSHMITSQMEHLELVQRMAFERFPLLSEGLLTQFDLSEVATFARDFIAAGAQARQPKASVARARNQCMLSTVKSKLFKSPESRAVLLPCILHSLSQQLQRHEQEEGCVEVLVEVLSVLQENNGISNHDISMVIRNMFYLVLTIIRATDKQAPPSHTGQYIVSLIAMLKVMKEEHYSELLMSFSERSRLLGFLIELFGVFEDLICSNVYAKNWMIMYMVQNNILVQATTYFTQALCDRFLKGQQFEQQVWIAFFQLAVTFITQWSLQLENFSEAKRTKILDKYGDIRTVMAFQVLSMWQALDDFQVKFVPFLIGPFVSMTLVPQSDLRKATMPIFFDMMEAEMKSCTNFKQVEDALFHHLDEQVSAGRGDEDYRWLLSKVRLESFVCYFFEKCMVCALAFRLTERCQRHPSLADTGITFGESLTGLLERLLDYRSVGHGEENRFKRTVCTVNLLTYYREIGRPQMYIRYIDKLCELHLEAGSFAEAGFTVLLHADMLEWKDVALTPQGRHPAERERERKERLLKEAISHFDKGKVWEEGIRLCKQLVEQYETELFDYRRLSQTLQTQAMFYDQITSGGRGEPIYCAVGFFGLGWPPFLRNKRYVFRGMELEKLPGFNQRLLSQCPQAQLMQSLNPPGDDILKSDGQYLQVCSVSPVPEIPEVFQQKNAKNEITHYYKFNEVKTFTFSRPFHRGKKDKELEFKTLWLEKNTLTTTSKLPGTLSCSEIVFAEKEELSPLKTALEQMTSKLLELRAILDQYQADATLNINPLSMLLKGMIDAAVMGGFSNYQKVFFVSTYLEENPDDLDMLNKLKQLIHEQVELLQVGLSLHSERVPPNLKPFHENLEKCYKDMQVNVAREILTESDSPATRRRQVSRSQTVAGRGSYREPVTPRPSRSPATLRSSVVGMPSSERHGNEFAVPLPMQNRALPPLPPGGDRNTIMLLPKPRPTRHAYEMVRSGSEGNLLGGTKEGEENNAEGEEDRYETLQPNNTKTLRHITMSCSDTQLHTAGELGTASQEVYDAPPPVLPPKRLSTMSKPVGVPSSRDQNTAGNSQTSFLRSATVSEADGPTLPIRAPRRRSQPDTGYSGSSLPSLSLSAGSSAGGHASSALPYRLPPPASQASPRSGLGTSPSTVRQRPRAAQPQHTQQATIPAQSTQQVTQSSNLNPFAPPPGVTPMFSTPAQETTTFTQSNGQVMAENNVCIPPPRTVPRPLGALSPVPDRDDGVRSPAFDENVSEADNASTDSVFDGGSEVKVSNNPFVQEDRRKKPPTPNRLSPP